MMETFHNKACDIIDNNLLHDKHGKYIRTIKSNKAIKLFSIIENNFSFNSVLKRSACCSPVLPAEKAGH